MSTTSTIAKPAAPTRAPKSAPKQAIHEVRQSPIRGRGVFALRDIPAGERIVEYRGERIS
ncbi:SET domain-containing protein-lysine N-methyltransferase [Sorangium sp. So ce1151]|uniref:SET domain-containing protein-lysine N-methyltransferase n=1 Tax=Sorangium sp. So ce1151 TaxID=3133332 RepID=UPI003F5DAF83